ncbi:MAG: peptidyl-prolyl cis-trans isomerase [Holosporaceae bacterium]|jgi:peptidyl-prolyl cis-trans isomerase C|nr:peptidyl-prolyl cis-trans isomerase [Holosporaceae bacterium]
MNNKFRVAIGGAVLSFCAFTEAEEAHKVTEVHAKHILVENEDQAKKIFQDIKSGKISFEDAAKESSICPSGQNGGDLGYFSRGAMVKEFEDAAFSMNKDEISNPVKTAFGWHLIKVVDNK